MPRKKPRKKPQGAGPSALKAKQIRARTVAPAVGSKQWLGHAMVRRLDAAGHHSAVVAGAGVLAFDGKRWMLQPGEHVDDAWDRLVGEHLLDELETEVSRELGYLAIMSRKNSRAGRVDVWTPSLPLGQAQVSGSAAFVNGERVGPAGNYLTAGAHWNAVRELIRSHARERDAPATLEDEDRAPVLAGLTETLRYLPDLPTTVTLADSLFASAQLADERTIAYSVPTPPCDSNVGAQVLADPAAPRKPGAALPRSRQRRRVKRRVAPRCPERAFAGVYPAGRVPSFRE